MTKWNRRAEAAIFHQHHDAFAQRDCEMKKSRVATDDHRESVINPASVRRGTPAGITKPLACAGLSRGLSPDPPLKII